jgi:tRNA threonylcarbamoyladenosine biosynthesis protein TsaE
MWTVQLDSVEQTQLFGSTLGQVAAAGTVVALKGELGAGKTAMSQGIGRGLGIEGPITSPTFIILAVYDTGRLTMFHADFYRLGDGSELVELGLDEAWLGNGLSVIEWPDKFLDELPEDRLELTLSYHDTLENSRILTVKHTGKNSRLLSEELSELLGG